MVAHVGVDTVWNLVVLEETLLGVDWTWGGAWGGRALGLLGEGWQGGQVGAVWVVLFWTFWG